MNKKQALQVLIENSYVLSQASKDKLLSMIENMTDEQVMEWGKLFTEEQDFVEENKESILAKIKSL